MHREEQPGGTHVPESYFLQTGLCYPLNQQHEQDHFHQQTPERKDAENNLITFVTINLSLFILLSWPGCLLGLRGTQEETDGSAPSQRLSTHQLLCCPTPEPLLHPWLLYLSEAPHLIDPHILGDLPWHLTHPAREAPIT